MRLLAIGLFVASSLFCQDAKIIIVERHDTQELKKAYADYKAARDAWEKTKADVAKRYTVESGKTLEGWEKVEFSVDFRALVPKHDYLTLTGGSGVITVPANGGSGWVTANALNTGLSATDYSVDGIRADVKTTEPSIIGANDIWIGTNQHLCGTNCAPSK